MSSDPRSTTIGDVPLHEARPDSVRPTESPAGFGPGAEPIELDGILSGGISSGGISSGGIRTRPRLPLGRSALIFAALLTGVQSLAIGLASNGHWLTATFLAWGVIVLSGLVFVAALIALIRGRARRSAGAALLVSLVSNPLVLIWFLDLFSGR